MTIGTLGNAQVSATQSLDDGSDDVATAASGNAFLAQLLNMLSINKDNYQDVWIKALQTSAEFMADIAELKAVMSQATFQGGNSNEVTFNGTLVRAKMQEIQQKYSNAGADGPRLFNSTLSGDAGKKQAEDWAREFGLDPEKVVRQVGAKDENGEGVYYSVFMDVSPLVTMISATKNGTMDLAQYNAMLAALDTQEQTIQSNVRLMAEKGTNAFSKYDTLVKALSSMVSERFAVLKDILR